MKTLVKINTNFGTITVELFEQKAPLTCLNFLSLIEEGYYNRSTFHRVIRSFMMQGGSEDGTGKGGRSKWGGMFNDEYSDLTFSEPYMLAMANSGPNTNTSQFFITVVPTPWLNGKHTIFGKVVDGVKIIDRIMALDSDANGTPEMLVVMLSLEVLKLK